MKNKFSSLDDQKAFKDGVKPILKDNGLEKKTEKSVTAHPSKHSMNSKKVSQVLI